MPRFHPIDVADADLTVGEYVVCLEERRRLALVRAFLDVARQAASRQSRPSAEACGRKPGNAP